MECLNHSIPGGVILPRKILSTSCEPEISSDDDITVGKPAKDIQRDSQSPETSKDDERIEQFVRSMLLERVRALDLVWLRKDRRYSKFSVGSGWKSWTELWIERCGDICPDDKELGNSNDEGPKLNNLHSSFSVLAASEVLAQKQTKSFWRRTLDFFSRCVECHENDERVYSLESIPHNAAERNDFREIPKSDAFVAIPGLRRSVSAFW